MWIGLLTLSLLVLSTSAASFGPNSVAACFQTNPHGYCVERYAPGCKGVPQAQFNDCCRNGSREFRTQIPPACKGIPQAQFNDCCANGSPVYGPGCAAPQPNNQRPLGGCVSVQAEYYQQCVAQNAPGCKGIPQAQFNDCCPNGSPVYGPGCVAPPPNNQRPLGGCVSVQAEYYQQCVAQNGELINLVSKMAPDISTFSSRQPRNAKMSRKSNSMTAAATVLRYMVQAALRLHPIIKCRSEAARVFKKSTICNASLNLSLGALVSHSQTMASAASGKGASRSSSRQPNLP
ncbi:hypothetical protein KEM48_003859 [Puccinia striiformis f. sp. tritici PST-130]|nr:hypothetical protein KEM48_003859 [Puccinia striiformis f. sp. tritici PST-130]